MDGVRRSGGCQTENRSGMCSIRGTWKNVERKEHLHRNQNETLLRPGVVPVLLYGSECWSLRKEDERRLLVAEMSWLGRIIGRSRREKVRNEQTREELGAQETVVQKMKKRRLQWFGHVERMDGKRLPNAALHGHVEGKRSRERQMKTWMDNVRKDLKEKNIDLTRIGEATRNIEVWRSLVRTSSSAR